MREIFIGSPPVRAASREATMNPASDQFVRFARAARNGELLRFGTDIAMINAYALEAAQTPGSRACRRRSPLRSGKSVVRSISLSTTRASCMRSA